MKGRHGHNDGHGHSGHQGPFRIMQPICTFVVESGKTVNVSCGGKPGKYIIIERLEYGSLSLCDVTIQAKKDSRGNFFVNLDFTNPYKRLCHVKLP